MDHNLGEPERMNQGDFQQLRHAEPRSDVLKEIFNLTSSKVNDADFRRSKYWIITRVVHGFKDFF